MKRLAALLLFTAFAAVSASHAQRQTPPPQSTTGSATDDAVGSISTLKRPTKATPAPANAAGPKKPLEARLTNEEKGKGSTTVFAASTPKIYLYWTDDTAAKGEKLRVVWVAEDAVGFSAKNKKLTESATVLPGGTGANGSFYLPAAGGGFPVGKYRADLYEGSKLAKSLKFTVQK